MAQSKFLTLSGLSVFKDNIISIIEENELVTSTALLDLNNKIDNLDIPIESGNGDNSAVLIGENNVAKGDGSIALGSNNTAYGNYSKAEGISSNKASDYIYNADGTLKSDADIIATWEGTDSKFSLAKGESSRAEGRDTLALGENSHAEGCVTIAFDINSHAEGIQTIANGIHSHSEGAGTTAVGGASHAEGVATRTEGWASHAEGSNTKASGLASHAEGYKTITNNNYEHAQGKYNVSNENTIHSVGIGTSDTDRINAHEIMTDGKHYILGIGEYDGTNISSATDLATFINEHTHSFTVNDNTDTLENILEAFSTSITSINGTLSSYDAALSTHIEEFDSYKSTHGSGVHISSGSQSFTGKKTFNTGVAIRKSYYSINGSLEPYPDETTAITRLSNLGLSFLHTGQQWCLAGLGLLPTTSYITDETILDGLVIDAITSVIVRSLNGLRIGTSYPSEEKPFTNRISFGEDIDNAFIEVPDYGHMIIYGGNKINLLSSELNLDTNVINIGTNNPSLLSLSNLTIETNGNLTLNSSDDNIICKSAVQNAYVYDHGTITATSKTIALKSGCLNKIEINANCALTLTLTNPNITSFNEYSARCIISCGTSVSTTNTITLPAMCGTIQSIQYCKTSIIELDIAAYPESSNGTVINYLCSWQYHRL